MITRRVVEGLVVAGIDKLIVRARISIKRGMDESSINFATSSPLLRPRSLPLALFLSLVAVALARLSPSARFTFRKYVSPE